MLSAHDFGVFHLIQRSVWSSAHEAQFTCEASPYVLLEPQDSAPCSAPDPLVVYEQKSSPSSSCNPPAGALSVRDLERILSTSTLSESDATSSHQDGGLFSKPLHDVHDGSSQMAAKAKTNADQNASQDVVSDAEADGAPVHDPLLAFFNAYTSQVESARAPEESNQGAEKGVSGGVLVFDQLPRPLHVAESNSQPSEGQGKWIPDVAEAAHTQSMARDEAADNLRRLLGGDAGRAKLDRNFAFGADAGPELPAVYSDQEMEHHVHEHVHLPEEQSHLKGTCICCPYAAR